MKRIYYGITTELPFAFRLPSLRGRAGGEAVVLLISKCKVTTFF